MLTEWEGKKIWQIKPHNDIQLTYSKDFLWLGKSYQNRLAYSFAHPLITFKMSFDQINLKERIEIWKFFKEQQGKLGTWLLRTFRCELTVLDDVPAGSTLIKLNNEMLKLSFIVNMMPVYIYREDFTRLYRILEVRVDSDPVTLETFEVLILDHGIEFVNIKKGDKLELVYPVRFANDSLNFRLYDIDVSTTSISAVTVIDYLPTEDS
jgi:hypothetical protein